MGANNQSHAGRLLIVVSIHAPVMGANNGLFTKADGIGFNPRTRDGCEQYHYTDEGTRRVSIHAPVMGANDVKMPLALDRWFQSTHP